MTLAGVTPARKSMTRVEVGSYAICYISKQQFSGMLPRTYDSIRWLTFIDSEYPTIAESVLSLLCLGNSRVALHATRFKY